MQRVEGMFDEREETHVLALGERARHTEEEGGRERERERERPYTVS